MKNENCICVKIFKYSVLILSLLGLKLLILFIIYKIPPDLHWKYSREQVHHILVWGEGNDTLQSAIEHWYIMVENPLNSRQEEIDSVELIITRFSDVWQR